MAYSLALTDPERFRALAVLSSWLPKELLARIEINAAAQSLPTLVQHGTEDSTIQVDRARGSVETLRRLKVPLSYREYSMGHEISPTSLSELSVWLEEKILSNREKK
jgi:phospholipase/carboxylesterase